MKIIKIVHGLGRWGKYLGSVSLSFLLLFTITLVGCTSYVPGQQSYWDAQVRELCGKDGGVTIYERVRLTQDEYRNLGGVGGTVPVPNKSSAAPSAPYVAETKIAKIREWGPEVYRRETVIIRVVDGKVLSRQVTYGRIGGDFPSHAHPSSYGCADAGVRLDLASPTFPDTFGKLMNLLEVSDAEKAIHSGVQG